jgi:hypothetical protein
MKSARHRNLFVLEDFFAGKLHGWGLTHTRFGKLANTFEIGAEGSWDSASKSLSLVERYRFDDGHADTLEWKIRKHDGSTYTGTEKRLVGEASGEQAENWYRWRYTRRVPGKNGAETRLTFDDCFYRLDDKVVMARASVKKFGFRVATISVFYQKR